MVDGIDEKVTLITQLPDVRMSNPKSYIPYCHFHLIEHQRKSPLPHIREDSSGKIFMLVGMAEELTSMRFCRNPIGYSSLPQAMH